MKRLFLLTVLLTVSMFVLASEKTNSAKTNGCDCEWECQAVKDYIGCMRMCEEFCHG